MLSKTVKVFGLLALLGALALPAGALAKSHHAGIRLSAHQKSVIRAHLMKQIKANPRMIKNKAWLRSAAIVSFQLPVTIRLNPLPFGKLVNSVATLRRVSRAKCRTVTQKLTS